MDEGQSITTAMWLMIAVQTIGSMDPPGKGERKLPAPRAFVAIIVAYSVLQAMSDTKYRKGAAVIGWTLLFTAMVAGPFGTRVIGLFNTVADQFNISPIEATMAPGQSTVPYPYPIDTTGGPA